jgi:hypothetical protein
MMTILWTLLWPIVRAVLGISKDMVSAALELVAAAQDLKHDDGTALDGTEKFEWVVDQMVAKFATGEQLQDIGKSTFNTLVELALAFLKSQTTTSSKKLFYRGSGA